MMDPTQQPQDATPAATNDTWEQEKLSRRSALRKFGFGAGMAALLALSSDELARMAGARLKQVSGDNRIANQIADEFKNAGVAFASPSGCARRSTDLNACKGCCQTDFSDCESNIPVNIRYPGHNIDCKAHPEKTECGDYRNAVTTCQDGRSKCQGACDTKF